MQKLQNTTNDIVLAIQELTRLINANNDYRGDISSLIQVTSNLELVNLDYWERLIRSELNNNLNSTIQSKGTRWLQPAPKLTWLDSVSADG